MSSGPEHRLVYMNAVSEEMVGKRPLGSPVRETFGDLRRKVGYVALLDQVLKTGEAVSLKKVPFAFGDHAMLGEERYASMSLSRVSLEAGEHGVLIVAMEITDQVASARVIGSITEGHRRSLQRFQHLLQMETQVVWVGDPLGRITEPSPGWQRLSGRRRSSCHDRSRCASVPLSRGSWSSSLASCVSGSLARCDARGGIAG
ncbi:PAS domain-containing protein [Nonomuraea sp. K274]|uniref:PAS domain-containing protein n=1 Tax=Nonomuraea cypriaca TaxID=1187855 RepID=A0A931AAU3_9ACTN|nr:PAS domain-containing protein [Nonomuraea cypriaca]